MNNKRLAELFKQKNCLEQEREKDFVIIWKSFCRIFFSFTTPLFFSFSGMIIRGVEFSQYSLFFFLYSFGLLLIFITFVYLCFRNLSFYRQKLDKINQQIVEELSKE